MKKVTITLYRFEELPEPVKDNATKEYNNSFLNGVTPLHEVWFTALGFIHSVFNV